MVDPCKLEKPLKFFFEALNMDIDIDCAEFRQSVFANKAMNTVSTLNYNAKLKFIMLYLHGFSNLSICIILERKVQYCNVSHFQVNKILRNSRIHIFR